MNALKLALKKIRRGGQQGFTLAEVMIALIISGIIISSIVTLSIGLTRTSGKTVDQSVANMQVQFAGFWMSKDAVQAQEVSLINIVGGAVAESGSVAQTDETLAAQSTNANDMNLLPAASNVGDAYNIGYSGNFSALFLRQDTLGVGVGTWTITWEYWNGSSWAALAGVTESALNASQFRPTAAGTYTISWTVPGDWATTNVPPTAGSLYWVRARVSSYTSMTTQPKGTRVEVLVVDGAVAQNVIPGQTDETSYANSDATNDMTLLPATPDAGDAYYIGYSSTFSALFLRQDTIGIGTWTITWKYWNGTSKSWVDLGATDETNDFKQSPAGWYRVSWTLPGGWATRTIQGKNLYWVKAQVTAYTSITTQPKGTRGEIPIGVGGAVADDGGVQTDQTTDAQNDTTNDMNLLPAAPAVGDAYYFGYNSNDFSALFLRQDTLGVGVGTWTITWEYLKQSGWTSFVPTTDGGPNALNFRPTAAGWYKISLPSLGGWKNTIIQGKDCYWVRARVSSVSLPITTQPKGTRVYVETSASSNVGGAVAQDVTLGQTNETTAANNNTQNDMTLLPATPDADDAYYFGYSQRFSTLSLRQGTQGAGTWNITWKYWNGTSWAALADVTDGTNGFTSAAGEYTISWTDPGDWVIRSIKGINNLYWVKAEVTSFTSKSTQPKGTRAGIPVNVGGAVAEDVNAQQTDQTIAANDADMDDMTLLPAAPAVGDAYYIGYASLFGGFSLRQDTPGVGDWTITWKYWNGTSWVALGATDETNGFRPPAAGDYMISWTVPGDWALKVMGTPGKNLYWVKADVTVYTSITTQPKGTRGEIPIGVGGAVADDGGAQTDETAAANNSTPNDMTLLPAAPKVGVGDAYYIGYVSPFSALFLRQDTPGAGTWTITWKYWNGAWVNLAGVTDETNGFKPSAVGRYRISWTVPGDWALRSIKGIDNCYWVKAEVTSFTSMSAQPKGTRAFAATSGFPLTLTWKRLDPLETHQVIYSMENVTDVIGRQLWDLYREYKLNDVSQGTILVAQYLKPGDTIVIWDGAVLELRVTALVDREDASRTYKIQPRTSP